MIRMEKEGEAEQSMESEGGKGGKEGGKVGLGGGGRRPIRMKSGIMTVVPLMPCVCVCV
jgi:hypothetical protein